VNIPDASSLNATTDSSAARRCWSV
jgi:hypothetical protein